MVLLRKGGIMDTIKSPNEQMKSAAIPSDDLQNIEPDVSIPSEKEVQS